MEEKGIAKLLIIPEAVRTLQRKLYTKAKQEPAYRFYALYDKVWRADILMHAYCLVRANKGSPGVDGMNFDDIEQKTGIDTFLLELAQDLKNKTYTPSPVRRVMIPKADGSQRPLRIPTIRDRVAQMVAKLHFEPLVELYFHADSYGYRPNKSAHQALEVTIKRCWRHDWALEFNIKGLFDNIDHQLLMKAVRKHTSYRWLLLYIERWLTAPIELEDGAIMVRKRGVPQGGVISPVLSNLFMHYAFDMWMERQFPERPFCHYADDGLVHCKDEAEAKAIKIALADRLQECGLEMHPDKSKIHLTRNMFHGEWNYRIDPRPIVG
ncbi:conserved hypothetical protein [Nitrosomonas nitrosa]|uniref:Reverse transcriptase domain-containing protein n=1 Tax=Nitrosomonas nitrosa TaxID=52442 RepID=A0A8H9DAS8_9PROT|nr:conserved hypothetical protein [Nitrosomonas nitrosa]